MAIEYRAFISYSHTDESWAAWLQRRLEHFRGQDRSNPYPLRPIFRDRSELSAGELNPAIESALAGSAALIVVCSPAAAASEWVAAEIRRYKELHPKPLILPLVVDGGDGDAYGSVFPEPLRYRGSNPDDIVELLAADLRGDKDGKNDAVLKLSAALLGTSFDTLKRRSDASRLRRLVTVAAGAVTVAVGAVALSVIALLARQDAEERRVQSEELVAFMIGDVRDELGRIGRLDLMEAVGNEALAYFETLDTGELTQGAMLQRGRALRQIGDVRVDKGDTDGGLRLYALSLEMLETATAGESDPTLKAQMLYEQAKTHEAASGVHYARGDIAESRAATLRFRDLMSTLVRDHPQDTTYLLELATAGNNLGALAFAEGKLTEAQNHLENALQPTLQLVDLQPDDLDIQSLAASIEIWLGNIAERAEDTAAALNWYQTALERERRIASIDPEPANRESLARVLTIVSVANRDTDPYQALDQAQEATAILRALVVFEPENTVWQQRLNRSITMTVGSMLQLDCDPDAEALLADARERSDRLLESDPENLESLRDRIDVDILQARFAIGTGAPAQAASLAAPAVERALEALERTPKDDFSKRYFLRALDVLVRGLWLQGRESEAQHAASRSLQVLAPIEDPTAAALMARLEQAAAGDWSGWPPEYPAGQTGCGP